jgi:dienelactone hydrolase
MLAKDDRFDRPSTINSKGLSVQNWLDNDSALLVSDKFDIWLVDAYGKQPARNLTNGLGRRLKMKFKLIDINRTQSIKIGDTVILSAYSYTTKFSGFYQLIINKKNSLKCLFMGPNNFKNEFGESLPIKATDATTYLIRIQSPSLFPNIFTTKDFIKFTKVSNIHPEYSYNWPTPELVKFESSDKTPITGVIYKPENFDKYKKYPVILTSYEIMSTNLYLYQQPFADGSGGQLDITWFVSHGYIVAAPDVRYRLGYPGPSAYKSIEGMLSYLERQNWVNSNKIGIYGHSFGGYIVNYTVTQTSKFAAAISSSGLSDFISGYNSLENGRSHQFLYEMGQNRLGATPWQRPDLYIENSPLFNLSKVETPILTVANKKDQRVNVEQGMELFLSLRRLGKRAWMLQYDGQGHGLGDRAYIDYLIRSTQFFDHYLKDAPAPRWMTQGIPTKLKYRDGGYEATQNSKTLTQRINH